MKILAVDLSGSESISANPCKYGGVGRTFYSLSKNIRDFYVAGNPAISDTSNKKFIGLSEKDLSIIRMGGLLDPFIKDLNFDCVLHTCGNIHLETDKKQVVWIIGQNEPVVPKNSRLLLHNKATQNPILSGLAQIEEFTLGLPIPKYQDYKKEDFIFQCTNHYPAIGSIELATLCNYHGIQCYFAGPISEGYQLKTNINGITTHYLGEITEEKKIDYLKRAKFFAALYSHPINSAPLSFKQALAYNCGIISTPVGYIPNVVENGKNGFLIQNQNDLWDAWQRREEINQLDCWLSVKDRYSETQMAYTFLKSIEKLTGPEK